MQIVSREEMQSIDKAVMESVGLPGVVWMENAGQAVFRSLDPELNKEDRIIIVAGKGNNGGDGFAAARCLINSGYSITVWLADDQEDIRGDAEIHMNAFLAVGGVIRDLRDTGAFKEQLDQATLIIDALLGTGMTGELCSLYSETIKAINHSSKKVVSIDVPSGVSADDSDVGSEAVLATATLTIHAPKLSQFLYPASSYYGETRLLDIGIPEAVMNKHDRSRTLWRRSDVLRTLPHRENHSHKGTYGNGLLAAGSEWMPGAAILAGLSALRSGLGRLTISLPNNIMGAVSNHMAEATYTSRQSIAWQDFDGAAIGPGLGRDNAAGQIVEEALKQQELPIVVDADGLYHLTAHLSLLKNRKAPVILTPHPGEMAHLTGTTIAEVERNRFEAAAFFSRKYGVYLVLKGEATLVTTPSGRQFVHTGGNPALAKGGSGDVLAGMIFAFLFQNIPVEDAINNAVYVHGSAAEHLTSNTHSMLDVLATDVIDTIPIILHDLYRDTNC